MRMLYVIGRFENDRPRRSGASFYAEGWLLPATWTYRQSANRYSNKRDAIREARKVSAMGYTTFVEPYHDPFRNVQPLWSNRREMEG